MTGIVYPAENVNADVVFLWNFEPRCWSTQNRALGAFDFTDLAPPA